MLNKKGFTLLELAAVVVVLAIIAVIIMPFISKSLKEAKLGAFKNSAYGLFEAAEAYYGVSIAKGQEFTETRFDVKNGLMFTEDNIKLLYNGSTPDEGSYVTINDIGRIQLLHIKGQWCGHKNFDDNEIRFGIMQNGVCIFGDSIGGKDAPVLAGGNEEWIIGNNKIAIKDGSIETDYYQYYKSSSPYVIENGEWTDLAEGVNEIDIDEEGEYYIFVRGIKDHMPTSISYPKTSKIDRAVYKVNIIQTIGGTITVSKDSSQLGGIIDVALTPAEGYRYKVGSLKVNKNTISGTSFTMPREDANVSVEWEKIPYTITIVNTTGGTFNANKTTAYLGDTITVTATPAANYALVSITYNDGASHDITSTKSFTMPAKDVTVTGSWRLNSRQLTIYPNGGYWNGSASPTNLSVVIGSTATIANPTLSGYTFAGWTLNGSGSSMNGTTFKMGTTNATLTANWIPNTVNLQPNASGGWSKYEGGGSVTLNSNNIYVHGNSGARVFTYAYKNYDVTYYNTLTVNYCTNGYTGQGDWVITVNVGNIVSDYRVIASSTTVCGTMTVNVSGVTGVRTIYLGATAQPEAGDVAYSSAVLSR